MDEIFICYGQEIEFISFIIIENKNVFIEIISLNFSFALD